MSEDAYREQLVALLPDATHVEHDGWSVYIEWSTEDTHWELKASWQPGRPARVAIHGPDAAIVLHRPTIATVEAYLHLLGAIPTNPLADALVAFCTGYTAAWADGDQSQATLLLDQLHTALGKHVYGPMSAKATQQKGQP